MARRLGLDELAVDVAVGSISASARRGEERVTSLREVGTPGVDAWRIAALERLAGGSALPLTATDLSNRLAVIDAAPRLWSSRETGIAIAFGCGAFAFLNGGGALEVVAAGVAGGVGQGLRSALARRRYNAFATAAFCALVASGLYLAISFAAERAQLGIVRHAAGFISSTLFLVPGFPLIAALLDLLQDQPAAALTRLAHGTMLLLASAFGLFVTSAEVGLDAVAAPPVAIGPGALLALRALASFGGACAFAVVFNSPPRTALSVGALAVVGNVLRLALHGAGVGLAPATFVGALAVGLSASLLGGVLPEPRIALTVPGIIMMVPGFDSFTAVVRASRGEVDAALPAAVRVGFVVGAMAMGLATARFVSQREWLKETPT
jgi:uncharacterized membrane protein YjjP (DUF1212 family)